MFELANPNSKAGCVVDIRFDGLEWLFNLITLYIGCYTSPGCFLQGHKNLNRWCQRRRLPIVTSVDQITHRLVGGLSLDFWQFIHPWHQRMNPTVTSRMMRGSNKNAILELVEDDLQKWLKTQQDPSLIF